MSVNILDSNRHLKSIAGGDVPIATNLNAGKVKPDGTTITITQDGTISAVGADPTPIATTEVAGKVKPDGTTITVTEDGTISSSAQLVPIATTEVAGKVKPDGSSITVAADGTITAATQTPPIATFSKAGIIKPNSDATVSSDGTLNTDYRIFKIDRRRLFSDGLGQSSSTFSKSLNLASGNSSTSDFLTITDPGIYSIVFWGRIMSTGSIVGNFAFYLDDDTSTYKYITCTNVSQNSSSSVMTGCNLSGIFVANANQQVKLGASSESVSSGTIISIYGQYFLRKVYDLKEDTLPISYWWQM